MPGVPGWPSPHLPTSAGPVAALAQQLGDRDLLGAERDVALRQRAVAANPGVAGVLARHQRRARRRTDRAAAVVLREARPFPGQPIERRRLESLLPVRPEVAEAEVVRLDEQDVRRRSRRLLAGTPGAGHGQEHQRCQTPPDHSRRSPCGPFSRRNASFTLASVGNQDLPDRRGDDIAAAQIGAHFVAARAEKHREIVEERWESSTMASTGAVILVIRLPCRRRNQDSTDTAAISALM